MRTYLTYILRLIIDEIDPAALRGTLRSVESGEEQPFSSEPSLLHLLRRRVFPAHPPDDPGQPGPSNPQKEQP